MHVNLFKGKASLYTGSMDIQLQGTEVKMKGVSIVGNKKWKEPAHIISQTLSSFWIR